ncbi:hypothetical protein SH1V18_11120 [Vallitalea longa]|uniref:Uncharacterized protein n=1 Tax=Vallitalea longa TaxID=2936439 RepID=A0A9W5Y8A4_9FIRM|nr:hypothetical protein [Vallitalea longa]GKX28632.1 hypothetical protein SH1V18_11120 [Vallitalea longa]
MNTMLLTPILVCILGIVAIVLIVIKDKKSRGKKTKNYKFYNKMFIRYDNFFITRNGIRRLYYRIAGLSVYTKREIIVTSVRLYSMSIGVFWGINLLGIIVFKDVFTSLLLLMFSFIVKTILVDKQINHIHFKLLQQLLDALSSIRQCYLRLGVIPDSIAEANVGPLLKHAFEDIYLILTAADGERRLEEFYASTPFKLLQTFSGVCYILNNSGDSKLSNGSSNFIQAMGMMHSEVQMEIQRLTLQRAKFGVLEYLPVIPLVTLKFIESFFISQIPGTATIYHGPLGYISKVLIFLSSIIGYITITKINSPMVIKKDDRNIIIDKIIKNKTFESIVKDFIPKKSRPLKKKKYLLEKSMSSKDIVYLYASKLICSLLAFTLSLFFIYFSIELGKDFILTNVREVSLVAGENLDEHDIEIRQEMDDVYLNNHPMLNTNKTRDFVNTYLPELQEYDKQAQIERLQSKYKSYNNTFFKWWMILICYALAVLAWRIPELLLRARIWLLKTEAEEDVLQLQTIITILMNTSTDTMQTLYWLQRQSRVHRNILIDAYHEYPSDPEMALHKLKSKVTVPEFKRIVDKLILTIHQISLADAFSDLISEREHLVRIREITQQATLKKKRSFVSPLSMAPLLLTTALYILMPLGILGIKEFMYALEEFGKLKM